MNCADHRLFSEKAWCPLIDSLPRSRFPVAAFNRSQNTPIGSPGPIPQLWRVPPCPWTPIHSVDSKLAPMYWKSTPRSPRAQQTRSRRPRKARRSHPRRLRMRASRTASLRPTPTAIPRNAKAEQASDFVPKSSGHCLRALENSRSLTEAFQHSDVTMIHRGRLHTGSVLWHDRAIPAKPRS